jgi:Glyoxalase-like domain
LAALPRLRQAVIASRDLERTAGRLQELLGLGESYSDPGVEYFGLRNAVFALGDTFLEVISPIRPDTSAGRLLNRRGDDTCYMLMFQIEDLEAARERARQAGIREVFELSLPDISEVHLHPADMRAAIVSLSQPDPPPSWRWGGPDWALRSAPLRITGATITVQEPARVADRWGVVLGSEPSQLGLRVNPNDAEHGLTEVVVAVDGQETAAAPREPITVGGVRFVFARP